MAAAARRRLRRIGVLQARGVARDETGVEVMLLDQRVPVSASATVSKRLPSTTMNACSELA